MTVLSVGVLLVPAKFEYNAPLYFLREAVLKIFETNKPKKQDISCFEGKSTQYHCLTIVSGIDADDNQMIFSHDRVCFSELQPRDRKYLDSLTFH